MFFSSVAKKIRARGSTTEADDFPVVGTRTHAAAFGDGAGESKFSQTVPKRPRLTDPPIMEEQTISRKTPLRLERKFGKMLENHRRSDVVHRLDSMTTDMQITKNITPENELTPEILNKVKAALNPEPPSQVLVEAFNMRITRKDIGALNDNNWLNEEVINFYFNLLMERGKRDNFPSIYAPSTFFYPVLKSRGFDSVKRWTRQVDIFAHDLMLVPIHLGSHWCLATVDFPAKKIQYYDSMGFSLDDNKCLRVLKEYVKSEHVDKKKITLDMRLWTLENVKDIPHQMNGSDCGMFACKYAEYISRRAEITFTQEDMPYFRQRMVHEIISRKLM